MLAVTLDIGMNGGINDTGRVDLLTANALPLFKGTAFLDDVVWVEGRQDAADPWEQLTVKSEPLTGTTDWELTPFTGLSEGSWEVRAVTEGGDESPLQPFTIDTTRPTVTISADKTTLGRLPEDSMEEATLTIVLSEPSWADGAAGDPFEQPDVQILPLNGEGSATAANLTFQRVNPTTFRVTFQPPPNENQTVEIFVSSNKFQDVVGLQNTASNRVTIEVFGEEPTVQIERLRPDPADAPVGVGQTVDVLFTLSAEPSADPPDEFSLADIVITGRDENGDPAGRPGSLSNLRFVPLGAGVPTYVATFTPVPGFVGNAVFSVPAAAFRDLGGNANLASGEFVLPVDTVAPPSPPAPVLESDTGSDQTDGITNVRTPTLSGTADGAAFVEVTAVQAPEADEAEPTPVSLGTAAVSEVDGSWRLQVDPVNQLRKDGVYSITVVARDAAGNQSAASPSLKITLDTVPPDVSPATLDPASDSGEADRVTNVTTPTFTGTAEAGAEVTLTLTPASGAAITLAPVVTEESGVWTATVPAASSLADGIWKVDVAATDAAGNRAVAQSPVLEIRIATNKPVLPDRPDLAAVSDSGISDRDDVTNVILPLLQGVAPLGTTVEVFVVRPGQTTPESLGSGLEVDEETGVWSLTVAAPQAFESDGDYQVTFRATDAEENVSDPSPTLTVTIDRTRPRAIRLTPPPPSPRGTPVSEIDAPFSEEVFGVGKADFSLQFRLVPANSPLDLSLGPDVDVRKKALDPAVWQLTGLEALTANSGYYQLQLTPRPSVTDRAGNQVETVNANGDSVLPPPVEWRTDVTPPRVVALEPRHPVGGEPVTAPINEAIATVTIEFSESVTGVDLADFRLERDGSPVPLTGTAATVGGAGGFWSLTGLAGLQTADGTYTLTLVATGSNIEDTLGTALASGGSTSWTIDRQGPTGAFDSVATPVGAGIESVVLEFSDAVSGLSLADFTLSRDGMPVSLAGATLSPNLAPSDAAARYLLGGLRATNSLDGAYELRIDVTGVKNAIGNQVAAVAPVSWTVDTVAPEASLSGIPPIDTAAVPAADLTFSLPVTGVDAADFLLTVRRPDGTTESLTGFTVSGSGATYTIDGLTALTAADGDYRLQLIAGGSGIVRQNSPANPLLADASIEWRVDATPPTVELSQLSWNGLATFRVRAVFSESVTGFAAGDVAIGGVGGTVGAFEPIGTSGREYRFDVTVAGAPTDPATVTVPAGSGFDDAGSGNQASRSLRLITDYTAPRVTLTGPAVTNQASFQVTAVFDEPVTGLTVADVQIVNGTVQSVTGAGTTFTIEVAPAADGLVRVSLPTGAAEDASGNPSSASNVLQTRYDATAPTVMLQSLSGAATRAAVLRVAVTFDEPVTGLASGDFQIVNGSAAGLSGSGRDYVLLVEPAAQTAPDGIVVEVSLPAGAAADAAGNPSGAATPLPLQILSDRIAPSVTLTGPIGGVVAIGFDEDVVGLDLADFSLTLDGRAVSLRDARLTQVNPRDAWELDLSAVMAANGAGRYELRLAAAASRITDDVGNPLAGDATVGFTLDATPPVATWVGIPQLVAGPLASAILRFSEPVVGLTAADIILLRDGVLVVPPGGITLSPAQGPASDYVVGGLAAHTAVEGVYQIRLVASATITDLGGNALQADAVGGWTLDATVPVASFGPVTPSPRLPSVFSADVFFSEPVVGVDIGDFRLVRDGVALRLAGARVAPIGTSGTQFRISNLSRLTRLSGDYTLTLERTGSRIADIAGNPLAADAAVSWTNAGAPTPGPLTAAFEPVVPNPRSAPVDAVAVTFSAVVSGVDAGDFVLQRTAQGATTELTGFTVAGTGVRRTVEGLLSLTDAPGVYTIRLRAAASGIASVTGQPLEADAVASWTRLAGPVVAPAVTITPDSVSAPGAAVDAVTLSFNTPVTGVRLAALRLSRDGIPLGLSGTVLTGSGQTYRLRGLAAIAASAGGYELRLVAAGSGIADAAGSPLAADGVAAWDVTVAAVRAAFLAVDPVRTAPLAGVRLRFSTPVLGVDVEDFELTRDGVPVPLYGVTVFGRATSWVIGNLAPVQGASGTYQLRLRAAESGIRSELDQPLAEDALVTWTVL